MTFDLEKARATYSAGCAEDAANLVPDLIAEIERLRGELASANVELLAAGELVTQLNQAREAEIDQAGAAERIYLEGVRAKDARIKELGEALVEADQCRRSLLDQVMKVANQRDKAEVRIQELEDALVEKQTALMPSAPRCYAYARKQAAIEQLQAEGKIGPDARPRSWRITEERIEFLRAINDILEDAGFVSEDVMQTIRTVLRAMLEEAGQ